jgi:predicted MFS family arabinose efflux permease
MSTTTLTADLPPNQDNPAVRTGWGAVFALTLCVSTLIASEFMPLSILSPIASELRVTEGAAGQATAISGLFAVLSSLAISRVTTGIDRRVVLLGLTSLMLLSGLVVTFAPSFSVLLVGRALIGVVIGGFWSMSASTVMRLVPEQDVPRALALLNGGNALATTIAAPLGAFLGQFIGWRGAFFLVVPLAALVLAWQWLSLPAMPSPRSVRRASAIGLLRNRTVTAGMVAIALLFMGQFAVFTYVRPFLEQVTGVSVSVLSLILLAMGAAGLVGTWAIGRMIDRSLGATLTLAPLAMAAIAVLLVTLGSQPVSTGLLLALWGLIGTAVPVAWWTWLSRTLPHDAEAGGGLIVAVVQLSITIGAAGGGYLFDAFGHQAAFLLGATLLAGSAALGVLNARAALSSTSHPHDGVSACG